MASAVKTYEVTLGTTALEITANPTGSNVTEGYPKGQITGVIPVPIQTRGVGNTDWPYPYNSICVVRITMSDGNHLDMEMASITNQSGWTPNLAGMQQCVADINAWL